MRDLLKDRLNTKREGVGGLLFLVCAMAIAGMLTFSTTLARSAMIRSVAESIEHTIALECLASCYTNPVINGVDTGAGHGYWSGGGDIGFEPIGSSPGMVRIYPVAQFNEMMTGLKLMSTTRPNAQSSRVEVSYTVHKNSGEDDEGYGRNQPSLDLKIGEFAAFDS